MTLHQAIERLYDLKAGTTPVEEGAPRKPLLLLVALDLIGEGKSGHKGKILTVRFQI